MNFEESDMLEVRKAQDRGHADHGWLKSAHSFSFADYFDEDHVEFGALRVINEDRVVPGAGFGTHPHRDMEIVSYVLEGQLAHRDSMGTGSIIRPGDVQRMSAGSGVFHSEHNPSAKEGVHFLQIWILPNQFGVQPSYEQKHFDASEKRGKLRLIVSGDGAEGSVTIHQNARLYAGLFDGEEGAALTVAPGRRIYVHLVRGELVANGTKLNGGDALKITGMNTLELNAGKDAEVLVFDLPGERPRH
jgi:quercetin 2,3-dioxygenase